MNRKMMNCLMFVLSLALMVSVVGCSGNAQTATPESIGSAPTTASAAVEPAADNSSQTAKDTLRVALPKNVTELTGSKGGLNSFNVLFQIFDMLVEVDKDMKVIPALATKWEMVDDLTWRFYLREDATFHNGEKFDAEDAKASVERLGTMDPKYFYANNWLDAWPPSAEVESEYVLLVKTSVRNLKVPELLSRVIMVPSDYANDPEFFSKTLNGTGAYKFMSWEPGINIKLEANDAYWHGAPAIKNLQFDFITDADARVSAYKAGEYDIIFDLPYSEVEDLKNSDKYKVEIVELVGLSFIYFNPHSTNPLISDVRIRQAMSYAIDSYGIVDSIMYGNANVVGGVANHLAVGYSDNGGLPQRDIEKAKTLMQEAGYNGEEIIFMFPPGEFNNSLEISELIVAQLQEVGFNVTFKAVEAGVWSSDYQGKAGFDIAPNNVPGTFTGEADYHWVHTLKAKIGWQSETIDDLLHQAYAAGDQETRTNYIKQAMDEAWNIWPYLWGVEFYGLYGANPNLEGVDYIPLNLLLYRDAKFTD